MNFFHETIRAAVAYVEVMRPSVENYSRHPKEVYRLEREAWFAAEDVGLESNELLVLAAAAGHHETTRWAKEYVR